MDSFYFDPPLLTLLQAVGVTLVLTQGSIFARLRNSGPALWQELWNCPLCAGVWVGGFFRWRELQAMFAESEVLPTLLDHGLLIVGFGAATGATALLGKRVLDYLESSAIHADEATEALERENQNSQ